MTVEGLIKAALRKLGVIASGESPSTDELSDGLTALQSMLRRWASKRMMVYASTKESFSLVAGTYNYTYGLGGTFNSARPHMILGGYILDSEGVTHPIDLVDEAKYRSITVKATISRPYAMYFHPNYPLASLYLYPVPDAVETLYIDSIKAFTETSSISATTDTLSFPPNYEEALIYNLAVRLASEFGKAIPVEVGILAESSYRDISTLNSANSVESIIIAIPAGLSYGARYSINSDSNH
jgi:hypothetical protein